MSAQSRVLATAAREIGYSRWTDKNRGTKYARETQPVFWPRDTWLLANGISYCDIFVTWVFWKALGKAFVTGGGLPAGASYNTDYRASKGGRVPKSQARPGDVLVFDWNWARRRRTTSASSRRCCRRGTTRRSRGTRRRARRARSPTVAGSRAALAVPARSGT